METNLIDEAEFATMNLPEYFVDDITVRVTRSHHLMRVYAGTWRGDVFVPLYSVIIPIHRILPHYQKMIAAACEAFSMVEVAPAQTNRLM